MNIRGKKKLIAISILAAMFALPGCKSENSDKEPSRQTKTVESVTITPKFSALFSGRTKASNRVFNTSNVYFSGELNIVNQDNQTVDGSPFPVMVLFDEVKQTATLNQSIILPPGTYKSSITLQGNGHQYIGDKVFTINQGTNPNIDLSIHPVIGVKNVELSEITELNRVRFQYPVDQLSQFTEPKLGISINGSTQEIYSINQQDSSADGYRYTDGYVDLETGSNKIELAFFDGQEQIGESHPDQEVKEIYPGENIQMDIIPLEGTLEFNLPFTGSDAKIITSFTLPKEAHDSSNDQLSVRISMIQEGVIKSQAQRIAQTTSTQTTHSNYYLNMTLPELYYGNYTMLMEFFKTSYSQSTTTKLGECSAATELEHVNVATACKLRIHRSDINASGNLLSSVHVTVKDENGFPVNGAIVQLNNILKTTSGGNDSSGDVSGYGHFYQKPGSYSLTATLNDMKGTQQLTLSALQSKSVFIQLDQFNDVDSTGDSTGDTYPGDTSGDTYPGDSTGDTYPGDSTGDTYPGDSTGDTYPGDSSGDTYPGDSTGDTYPGDSTGDTYPGDTSGDTYPGDTSGDTYPGDSTGDTYPGDTSGDTYPGDSSGDTYPGDSTGDTYSGDSTGDVTGDFYLYF